MILSQDPALRVSKCSGQASTMDASCVLEDSGTLTIFCTFVLHVCSARRKGLGWRFIINNMSIAFSSSTAEYVHSVVLLSCPSCTCIRSCRNGLLFSYVQSCTASCLGTDNAGMAVQPALRDTERRRPQGSLAVARSGIKSGKPTQTTGCVLRCLN